MATKILVVDDEQCIRDVFVFTLSEFGCEITCAQSIEEALDACQKQVYSLAFIDVVLPDGLGIELAEKLFSSHPEMPCCILTGHPDKFSKIREDYALRGAKLRIMLKPIWPEQILEAASSLLDQGQDSSYCNIEKQ